MHGIIGQLATDPARLAIAVLVAFAVIAIARCLSELAHVDTQHPTKTTHPETKNTETEQ